MNDWYVLVLFEILGYLELALRRDSSCCCCFFDVCMHQMPRAKSSSLVFCTGQSLDSWIIRF